MPRGVSRPTQGLEVALLTGGAATAAGLYVSSAVLGRAYVVSRRLFSWLLPEDADEEEERHAPVPCDFMKFKTPCVLFARERGGGGLLLAPMGVFYLSAPSMQLYQIVLGPDGKAPLETHAHYLFWAALSWMPNPTANANRLTVSAAWERLLDFAGECMVHMLLNDLFRCVPTLSADQKTRVTKLLDRLTPSRGLLRVSAPPTPTARQWLAELTDAQWQALSDALMTPAPKGFRVTPQALVDAFRVFGAGFGPLDTRWRVGLVVNAAPSASMAGVGPCVRCGRLAYCLISPSR